MQGNTFKGYLRDLFQDAWARYLCFSFTPAGRDVTPSQAAKTLNETQVFETSHTPSVTLHESGAEAAFEALVTPVTVHAIQPTHAEKAFVTGEL